MFKVHVGLFVFATEKGPADTAADAVIPWGAFKADEGGSGVGHEVPPVKIEFCF